MLILYTTEDGKSRIQLRADENTVWLTQLEMADLFATSKQNISLHLQNIFEDRELEPEATIKESLTVQIEGGREVQRPVTHYNLDAILAVGYRVRSPRGVQFRRWASTVLKEYLLKGFAMDDERLKTPDGRPDHFDEMLARIRTTIIRNRFFLRKSLSEGPSSRLSVWSAAKSSLRAERPSAVRTSTSSAAASRGYSKPWELNPCPSVSIRGYSPAERFRERHSNFIPLRGA